MADKITMLRLHRVLAGHCGEIAELFSEPVHVTILVRNPAHPGGERDVQVGDDTLEAAVAALRRVMTVGEPTPPPAEGNG